jgi:hypothetical protein
MQNFQIVRFAELFARFFQNALFNRRFVAYKQDKTNLAAVFFDLFYNLGDVRVVGIFRVAKSINQVLTGAGGFSRKIHYVRQIKFFIFQITPQNVAECKCAEIADVREAPNRRTANIHSHVRAVEWLKFFDLSR